MPVTNVIKKTASAPTVIIAGGAGFIGSHLVEALLLKDARVIVLDNFKTGKDTFVGSFLNNPKFALYNADINNGLPAEIESADYVIHLVDLEIYLQNKANINLDLLLTNAVGTKNLLDLANRSQAKFLLVSSTDVYKGHISNVNLSQYFGQTPEEENKYSLAEAKRFAEALVWEYFKKFNTNVRVVRVPEIFGPKMTFEASGNLGLLLKDLVEGRDLTIHGDGVNKEYYLYISDAISGIVKSLFGKGTESKIYTLVSHEPYSTLEVAYLLKNLADRELKILFKSDKKDANAYDIKIPDTHTLRDLHWEPKITLKEGILKTLKWFGYEINAHTFKPAKFIDNKIEEKKSKNVGNIVTLTDVKEVPAVPVSSLPVAEKAPSLVARLKGFKLKSPGIRAAGLTTLVLCIVLSFITIFVALPLYQTYTNAKKGAEELELIPQTLGQLDSPLSQETANKAFQHFYSAKNAFQRVKWLFVITGKSAEHTSLSRVLASGVYFSRSVYNLAKAAQPFNSIWEVVRPNSEAIFNEAQFDKSKLDLANAKNDVQLALAEFKYVDTDILPGAIKDKVTNYEIVLNLTATNLDALLATVTDMPDLLGLKEPKKYLILFQNSNEIRPTGGFIGSYSVLKIDKGKIVDLMIDDVYNPDGQLAVRKIQLPTPAPIKTLLKEDNLTIRNANWDPNFSDSAETIEDLFFRLNGEKVDGVIAVDLNFAKNLLRVTGPIFLTAYNEEINADNLYERAQFYSEFNYADGSDQKRSFLTVLGSKLLEKLFALPKEKMPQLFSELHKTLSEKHLLVHVSNSSVTTLLQKHGWDGNLVATNYDYLYVVNANLGGTKANYFVKNAMAYTVSAKTRDGLLRGEVTLTYDHTGKDNSWPGGPYTDYVRVLTPKGTKLTSATIKYNTSESKDIFKEVVIASVKNYNSFETSFVLNPQEKVSVVLSYDLPASTTISAENKNYNLYWQKQPGTDKDTFSFSFTPPFGTTALTVTAEAGELTTDKVVAIQLE